MAEKNYMVRIGRITQHTPGVRSMVLKLPEGAEFEFQPGQYVEIRLPEPGDDALSGEWKGFSITSSPPAGGLVEVTASRRGPFTRKLYDLPAGSPLEIRGPGGNFVYELSPEREPVFIAGGIGITPIMSMIRYLCGLNFPVSALLIYSCRAFEDIVFRPELLRTAEESERFRTLFTLTRSFPPDWEGKTGRVDQAMLEEMIPLPADKSYYICGPQDMMLMVGYSLMNMGIKKEQIATDLW